jgi:hypothetical protein
MEAHHAGRQQDTATTALIELRVCNQLYDVRRGGGKGCNCVEKAVGQRTPKPTDDVTEGDADRNKTKHAFDGTGPQVQK